MVSARLRVKVRFHEWIREGALHETDELHGRVRKDFAIDDRV